LPGKVTFPGAGGTESTLVPPATFLRAVLARTKWRLLSWQISGPDGKGPPISDEHLQAPLSAGLIFWVGAFLVSGAAAA